MTASGSGEPPSTPSGPPPTSPGAPTRADGSPPPSSPAPARKGGQGLSGDWPAQAADLVVTTVDSVRDKTTGPLQTAARAAVYGVLAGVIGLMVGVLLLVGLIRVVDVVLGLVISGPTIWLTYLILGVLFTIVGLLVFRRRRADEI